MAKDRKGDVSELVTTVGAHMASGAFDASLRKRRPALAEAIIVTSGSGKNEYAAIVTAVESEDVVTVLLLPAGEQPYPVSSVPHVTIAPPGALSWRWPRH